MLVVVVADVVGNCHEDGALLFTWQFFSQMENRCFDVSLSFEKCVERKRDHLPDNEMLAQKFSMPFGGRTIQRQCRQLQ